MSILRAIWLWLVFLGVFATEGKIVPIRPPLNFALYKPVIKAFVDSHPYVSLISSLDSEKYVVDEFVSFLSGSSTTFTLNTFDTRNTIVIIMTDSLKRITFSKGFKNKTVHVIVLIKEETFDIQDIFKEFRYRNILDAYIVYELQGSTLVATYNPFSEGNCYNLSPVILFNSTQDQKFVYSPQILKNFNKCPIRIGLYVNVPYVMYHTNNIDLNSFYGRDVDLLRTLAEIFNITISFVKYETQELREVISSLTANTSDAIIGDFYLRYDRLGITDNSIVYCGAELGFIVPKGQPFTSFESLLSSQFSVGRLDFSFFGNSCCSNRHIRHQRSTYKNTKIRLRIDCSEPASELVCHTIWCTSEKFAWR